MLGGAMIRVMFSLEGIEATRTTSGMHELVYGMVMAIGRKNDSRRWPMVTYIRPAWRRTMSG